MVAEVQGVVDRREAYFREQGIDSIETYRTRRAQGRADDGWGDVFLVVDGWSTLRAEFDDLEMELQQLAGRGLTFGMHLIAASARWADFRAAMRDVFGSRLELRLGDPLDSEIDRKVAALVPTGRPGRGLVPSKLHFLGALPRVDGDADAATLGDGVDDLVERASRGLEGPPAPSSGCCPTLITLDKIREDALRRQLDGEAAAASASTRRSSRRSASTRPPSRTCWSSATASRARARCCATTSRRSCARGPPRRRRSSWSTTGARCSARSPTSTCSTTSPPPPRPTPTLKDIAGYLESRIPGPDVTPEQLRNRSWWTGAEVFVVVDDYDLVATQQSLAGAGARSR